MVEVSQGDGVVIQTTCWDERQVPKNQGKNIGDAWMFGACLWFNRDMCGRCLIYASATILAVRKASSCWKRRTCWVTSSANYRPVNQHSNEHHLFLLGQASTNGRCTISRLSEGRMPKGNV